MTVTPAQLPSDATTALVERIVDSTAAAFDLFAIYVGDRLGLYRALADGEVTSGELADRTSTTERYVREWLEQQAVTGILEVVDASAGAHERRYRLPEASRPVLVEPESLDHLAPMARLAVGLALELPDVVTVFRDGGGIPWHRYGPDVREAQGDINRPLFTALLGDEYLPRIPAVDERLRRDGARVADIGCGVGWSSIGIARAYPNVMVEGFDVDAPSIELAEANARDAGVEDRVRFQVADAGRHDGAPGAFDVACAFECIHDLSDPVGVLATMRRLVGDDGVVLVMDERVADTFTAPGDVVERLMYGYSITACLPGGLAEPPAVGTGTVMRASTLEGYAAEAGYRRTEVLDLDNDFFRFYLLVP